MNIGVHVSFQIRVFIKARTFVSIFGKEKIPNLSPPPLSPLVTIILFSMSESVSVL